ncbi:MAG TPA: hypothetical protein VGF01_07025 [Terracidiphilus sp.]|jgi:hypothetical protein
MQLKMKSHQPLLRVVAWMQQNSTLIPQASFPAYEMKIIIRMEGISAALDKSGVRLELARRGSMALIEVNQRGKGRVKRKRGRWAIGSNFFNRSELKKIPIALI